MEPLASHRERRGSIGEKGGGGEGKEKKKKKKEERKKRPEVKDNF